MTDFTKILQKYWGYDSFRPLQEDIISSVYSGKDTLGLMPTGGGKSITFQVPALAHDGICIVVTPLIALMLDQVENLKKKEIKAVAIYSGMTKNEIDVALNNCVFGHIKFLYVSPERLSTEIFKSRVERMNVSLIAVDEAHCISQWGYDFRPSYLQIAEIRNFVPDAPVLALTATATKDVVKDIQSRLLFREENVFQKSFERENLAYVVRKTEDKRKELLNIAKKLKGTGIVYVRNRKKAKELAFFLQQNRISTDYYHAGLKHDQRNLRQDAWKRDKTRIMVTTNAFGMGIDKPDVRFVIHIDLPNSLEEYYQEAGRAGRDGNKSFAVLIYNKSDDVKLKQRVDNSFPDIKTIKKIYHDLGDYFQIAIGGGKGGAFDFNLIDFVAKYHYSSLVAYSAIKFLERESYVEMTEEVNNPSRVHFLCERDDLYKFQVANGQYDPFIKLLLRTYSGMFSEYVNINEKMLAAVSGTDVETIYTYLKKLQNLKIIKYIPQRNTPMIFYREERLDMKSLYISKENYDNRKERYLRRLRGMYHYAASSNYCRSVLLLKYFGEEQKHHCGQCDVCLEKKKKGLSPKKIDVVKEKIINRLKGSPVKPDQLIDEMRGHYDASADVVQWMLDEGEIKYNTSRLLILPPKDSDHKKSE